MMPGTQLGPDEILSPLGASWMGEVYREPPTTTQINIVLNWFEEFKRLVPTGK